MAVTKTPRKKPAATTVEEETPAPTVKAAPAKKAAPKKAEPKAKAGAKAAKIAAPVDLTPEVLAAPAPSPEPTPTPAPVRIPNKPVVAMPLPPLVEALYAAIREGRAVEFIFADTDSNAPRTFEPRHLTFEALSQAWFVWGWDRRYNAERHHRVDLLAEVNDVEGVGRAAQGPYPDGTPANLIGGWLGGDAIVVKATLAKQWVFAVKQAPPAFPQFKLVDQGDGQALVSFTATDLRAIARWAMQFGDGIQVLEPARLVDRIKQVGAVWAGRERQAVAAPSPKPASEPRRHESRPHREPRPDREARPDRESRPDREARPERDARPDREPRQEREPRHDRERDEPAKGKAPKVEVLRFDRL